MLGHAQMDFAGSGYPDEFSPGESGWSRVETPDQTPTLELDLSRVISAARGVDSGITAADAGNGDTLTVYEQTQE